MALALLLVSLVAVAAVTVQRFAASGKKSGDSPSPLMRDRPSAATAEPRKLELPAMPPTPASATSAIAPPATAPLIPALVPTAEELAEPIGVRRTGSAVPASPGQKVLAPEDAPVLLVTARPGAVPPSGTGPHQSMAVEPGGEAPPVAGSARPNDPLAATTRNLQGYQRQLQGLLDNLTRSAALATGQATGAMPSSPLLGVPPLPGTGGLGGTTTGSGNGSANGGGLFGGQLLGSGTPRIAASMLGNRSLTLPKGTAFTCALKTRVISATSGFVGCQVQRNVYSDDGRVLLIERGSHLDGEFRVASVRPGTVRIPVLWTRVRTPLGVTIDIESPSTGPLGEPGMDGYIDNRWGERIGAALLLSLIDDSVKLIVQGQSTDRDSTTVVLPSTTDNTSKLAEKVLDSTINIPPLLYQNQGGIVGIYVARDVDFSAVYELRPSDSMSPAGGAQ
ncbi:type IV secretion system protein VirB10 [Ideonella alba]|uniref:type IV secretion system protein VirB10 n=1 Tax=Ideonella alba TaxID=2824118 RepID=UPI001FFD2DD5|nr:type IV secretion system protein VirB10 [Ideonella alba]